MVDSNRPATAGQIKYVKDLFRKVKLYYNCQDDASLAMEVRERTGYDLNDLKHSDVQEIIAKLAPEVKRKQDAVFNKWGRKHFG